jgi:hypothetical protein
MVIKPNLLLPEKPMVIQNIQDFWTQSKSFTAEYFRNPQSTQLQNEYDSDKALGL